jgi:hypothetical protein
VKGVKTMKPKKPSQSVTLMSCAALVVVAVLMLLFHVIGAVDLSDPMLSGTSTALMLALGGGVLRLRTSQPIARSKPDEVDEA